MLATASWQSRHRGGGMDLESFVEPSKIAESLEHFLQPDRTTVQWHVLCRNGQWLMVNPVCPHWAGEIGKVCKKIVRFLPATVGCRKRWQRTTDDVSVCQELSCTARNRYLAGVFVFFFFSPPEQLKARGA